MVVLSLVAALALSQAEPLVREPIRPDDGVAPRAQLNREGTGGSGREAPANTGTAETTSSGADLARTPDANASGGSGSQQQATTADTTATNDEGAANADQQANADQTGATGGSGQTQAGFGGPDEDAQKKKETALEAENRRLREQLQQMNGTLQESLQAQQQTTEELQQIKEQQAEAEENRQAELARRADVAARRESSLNSASQSLSTLAPDTLHDSSDYAAALESARWEIFRAGQLHPDTNTVEAQEALNRARAAFENRDLYNMWLHVQEAQMYLGRAQQITSNPE